LTQQKVSGILGVLWLKFVIDLAKGQWYSRGSLGKVCY
jgi:hypothetical protein